MRRFAAATRHRYGKGAGYYVGTVVKEPAFYDALVAEMLKRARIRPALRPPEGVEAGVRKGGGKALLFLVNHLEEARDVRVPSGKRELLSGRLTAGSWRLDPFGVAVVRLR
jgi:beta-galactosidase